MTPPRPFETSPLDPRALLVAGGDPAARLALARALPGPVAVVGDDAAWLHEAESQVALALSLPPADPVAAEIVVAAVSDRFRGLRGLVHLPPVVPDAPTGPQWTRGFGAAVVAVRALDAAAAPLLSGGWILYGMLEDSAPEHEVLNEARRTWGRRLAARHAGLSVEFAAGARLAMVAQRLTAQAPTPLRAGLQSVRRGARALRRRMLR